MIPSTSLLISGVSKEVSINNQNIEGTATAAYSVNSNGNVYGGSLSGGPFLERWLLGGSLIDFEIKVTGPTTVKGSKGSWLPMTSTNTWYVAAPPGGYASAGALVEIRDSTTLVVLDSANVTLTADNS